MKNIKVILTTVVLGAVGSGVWQYVLSPILSKTSNFLLSIGTLGLDTYKDALYADVAKGFHEYASYSIESKINIIIGIGLIFAVIDLLRRAKSTKDRKDELLRKLDRLENPESDHSNDQESISEIRDDLNSLDVEKPIKVARLMMPFVVLILSFQVVSSYTKLYENRAITYFYQSKSIVTPYLPSGEIAILESKFSSMKTAEEYYSLVSRLKEVADKNNTSLPSFDPW